MHALTSVEPSHVDRSLRAIPVSMSFPEPGQLVVGFFAQGRRLRCRMRTPGMWISEGYFCLFEVPVSWESVPGPEGAAPAGVRAKVWERSEN